MSHVAGIISGRQGTAHEVRSGKDGNKQLS
jgi:hypothetical protein